MIESEENGRDLVSLVVPRSGRLEATGEDVEPYRLLDGGRFVVEPVAVFLRELLASGRSAATLRSYGMDLLQWWRFLQAVDVGWDRATRVEARDFSCWIQLTAKQRGRVDRSSVARLANGVVGAPNPITDAEIQKAKDRKHRKARMDQRTRERLPVLPVLTSTANDQRLATSRLLAAAQATEPGAVIDGTNGTLRKAIAPKAIG